MIDLREPFFTAVQAVDWFSSVGKPFGGLPIDFESVTAERDALASVTSDQWVDAKTEAQGALTGYLAKHHRSEYGTRWNELVKDATARLDVIARPAVQDKLQLLGWGSEVAQIVIVDLTRAALEVSYRAAFSKAPVFFEHLFSVYAAGHLPCGWIGELDDWPSGELLLF